MLLRPLNITYKGHRLFIAADDVGINAHMSYRVKTKSCTLVLDESLPDMDAIDIGRTVEPAEKKVTKVTTRYTCAYCKAGFEAPAMAGRAKACPKCGMATVIDHAAQKQKPVQLHWSDGINASPEEKATMKQYMTSKEYIERPAQHLEAALPAPETIQVGDVPYVSPFSDVLVNREDTGQADPGTAATRYKCNSCEAGFERAVLVNKKKTCRECGSEDITDNVVLDVEYKE